MPTCLNKAWEKSTSSVWQFFAFHPHFFKFTIPLFSFFRCLQNSHHSPSSRIYHSQRSGSDILSLYVALLLSTFVSFCVASCTQSYRLEFNECVRQVCRTWMVTFQFSGWFFFVTQQVFDSSFFWISSQDLLDIHFSHPAEIWPWSAYLAGTLSSPVLFFIFLPSPCSFLSFPSALTYIWFHLCSI
jgi:hypothetical protein